jgi:hypothetical protein
VVTQLIALAMARGGVQPVFAANHQLPDILFLNGAAPISCASPRKVNEPIDLTCRVAQIIFESDAVRGDNSEDKAAMLRDP